MLDTPLYVDDPINLYYFTGHKLSAGKLIIGEEQTLYVDPRYIEACAGAEPLDSFPSHESLIFDSEVVPYATVQKLRETTKNLEPRPGILQKLRSVKRHDEIEKLRASAALCARGYDFCLEHLKPHITEQELALELEIFWRREGGEKLSFDPIIAFGPASAQPHYKTSKNPYQNQTALLDMGVTLNSYTSDMTRVVNPLPFHSIVEEAFAAARETLKPGVACKEVDHAARQVITKAGHTLPHSLGHGVGLEVHEAPRLSPKSSETIEAGMVVTIEPGIYIPGTGGVRLEDTFLVTETGCESLTNRPLRGV